MAQTAPFNCFCLNNQIRFVFVFKNETLYLDRNSKEVNTHQTNQPLFPDVGKISDPQQKKRQEGLCCVTRV